jgi:hypothetical protein
MLRGGFVSSWLILITLCFALIAGCRGRQFAHVLKTGDKDIVGSHTAGAETFNPLVEESVGALLARQSFTAEPTDGYEEWPSRRICFVGIENRSSEELGDFHDQLYQQIDTLLANSDEVELISGRFVDAGLRLSRLKPDELFIPSNMRQFSDVMQQNGQPFDYLLFGTLTSGTTESNADYQRDYLLTLELINVTTGQHDKESAKVRKGYHKSALGKAFKYSPFR